MCASLALAAPAPSRAPEPVPPSTPREFYNAGTQKLREGKFREAEAFLESTLASQNESLQPPALYNLGHVRFAQGVEELKKGPAAQSSTDQGRGAEAKAEEAIRSADEALAGNDIDQLVAAYLNGRGVRKELRAATAAVKRALESYGATLARWQRAADDFKGAAELDRRNTDARHNAEVVERCIAKLVDTQREMQQCMNGMCSKKDGLGQKLKQLRGRIPAPNMPPGAAGDEDEEEQEDNQQRGLEPGQKENPGRDGEEMNLSPEQAGWLLNTFKLDSERRLPMGGLEPGDPNNRNRPTW